MILINVNVPDMNRATGFAHESRQNVDKSRFARPIGTQQSKQGAARNVQLKLVKSHKGGFALAVGFVQPMGAHGDVGCFGHSSRN